MNNRKASYFRKNRDLLQEKKIEKRCKMVVVHQILYCNILAFMFSRAFNGIALYSYEKCK